MHHFHTAFPGKKNVQNYRRRKATCLKQYVQYHEDELHLYLYRHVFGVEQIEHVERETFKKWNRHLNN